MVVTMTNQDQFSPQSINVMPGTVVKWMNGDADPHTVTVDSTNTTSGGPSSDTSFPSGLPSGQSYSWTVPANSVTGTTWFYHCRFHGASGNGQSLGTGMAGSLIVGNSTGVNDDVLLIQHSNPSVVGAGIGNDTYILSPFLLTGTENITLSDVQGINLLQLASGLSIAKSEVAATSLRLTLSNGAKVTVLGANAFNYDVGGNAAAGINHTPVTFTDFAQGTLGVMVQSTGIATGGSVTIP